MRFEYVLNAYRQLQQEIAQQNADSLRQQREAKAAESKARTDRITGLRGAAERVIADPSSVPEQTREFEVARAHHILRYGEDLPDAAISSYYSQPRQRPSQLLTPEEEAQKVRIAHASRPPRAEGTGGTRVARWETAKYGPGTLPTQVEKYVFSLRKKYVQRDKTTGAVTDDGYARAREELMNKLPQIRSQGNWQLDARKALALLDRLYRKQSVQDYDEGFTEEPDDVPPMPQ